VLAAIALNAKTLQSAERVTLGAALASAGFKDARLARLLNARGDQFEALAVRAARFIAAKGQPADWVQYATLVLAGPENEAGEKIRLQIARDFYAAALAPEPKEE
jgi:CRISPR system Cascade subunit CasB